LPDFSVLPPHFTTTDDNADIDLARQLSFGNLGIQFEATGMLNLLLASMVHYIDFLQQYAATDSHHPFNAIPILQYPNLVARLRRSFDKTQ
jgi:hypothetical protein